MQIIATVTNDLITDQRMIRICTTLTEAGHQVRLVGRVLPNSTPLPYQPFSMTRIQCWFQKGPFFYLEYNIRLCLFLMLNPIDAINAIDLDTLPAVWLASRLRRKPFVFDAHEHFTEVPEVTNRRFVKTVWHQVGKLCIPDASAAYTVGPKLAELLASEYKAPFSTVKNVPLRNRAIERKHLAFTEQPYVFYQGALNIGRGLEQAIDAMQQIKDLRFLIAGDGDIAAKLREQVKAASLEERIIFLGRLQPDALAAYTERAWLGLNLLEPLGLSYKYSLANKFFDYIQAGVPALCVDFPEYRDIVHQHEVAVLLPDILPNTIAQAIKHLQENEKAHRTLRQACQHAAEEFCWERERENLLSAWSVVFTETL